MSDRPFWGNRDDPKAGSAGLGVLSRKACGPSLPGGRTAWEGRPSTPGGLARKAGAWRGRCGPAAGRGRSENPRSPRASGGCRGFWGRRRMRPSARKRFWSRRKPAPGRSRLVSRRRPGVRPCWGGVWRRTACRPVRAAVGCSLPQTTDRGRVRTPFAPRPSCRACIPPAPAGPKGRSGPTAPGIAGKCRKGSPGPARGRARPPPPLPW